MPVRGERGHLVRRFAPLALMPAAAFAVHQLRYWLAFGGHAGAVLRATGHSYLHSAAPWLALFIAVSVGAFLRSLGHALGNQRSLPRYTVSFAALWLVCAAGLVAIFAAQEFLEGLLVSGHPGGLEGIFGYGGWWAIPASLAVALVLAAVFHGARWVLHEIAARYRRTASRCRRAGVAIRAPHGGPILPLAPLADGWSGRGPPR